MIKVVVSSEQAVRLRLADDLANALDQLHHELQGSKHMFSVLEVCGRLGIDFHPSSGKAAA